MCRPSWERMPVSQTKLLPLCFTLCVRSCSTMEINARHRLRLKFFALLVNYYETAIVAEIKDFLYQTTIDGFNKQHTEQPPLNKNMFSDMVEIINDRGATEHITREALAMRILEGENVRIVGETEESDCGNAQLDVQDRDDR